MEKFYLVDRFHGRGLHDDRGAACLEAYMSFAGESACMTADNARNGVVTIHRWLEVLKMLSFYT
jgi:hypothetical protein